MKLGENAGVGDLETFEFRINSTNMTNLGYGIAANVVASLLYGSNLVPIKRIETGDGNPTALLKYIYIDVDLVTWWCFLGLL